MRNRLFGALGALWLLAVGSAHADVFGRLQVRVGGVPAPAGARVTLRDTAGVRGDVTLTMGKDGGALSPPLESRAWQIVRVASRAGGANLLRAPQPVQVAADTTTGVTITLDPARSGVAAIAGDDGAPASLTFRRDREFIRKYPVTAGDPQNLGRVLQTVPGVSK